MGWSVKVFGGGKQINHFFKNDLDRGELGICNRLAHNEKATLAPLLDVDLAGHGLGTSYKTQ